MEPEHHLRLTRSDGLYREPGRLSNHAVQPAFCDAYSRPQRRQSTNPHALATRRGERRGLSRHRGRASAQSLQVLQDPGGRQRTHATGERKGVASRMHDVQANQASVSARRLASVRSAVSKPSVNCS